MRHLERGNELEVACKGNRMWRDKDALLFLIIHTLVSPFHRLLPGKRIPSWLWTLHGNHPPCLITLKPHYLCDSHPGSYKNLHTIISHWTLPFIVHFITMIEMKWYHHKTMVLQFCLFSIVNQWGADSHITWHCSCCTMIKVANIDCQCHCIQFL